MWCNGSIRVSKTFDGSSNLSTRAILYTLAHGVASWLQPSTVMVSHDWLRVRIPTSVLKRWQSGLLRPLWKGWPLRGPQVRILYVFYGWISTVGLSTAVLKTVGPRGVWVRVSVHPLNRGSRQGRWPLLVWKTRTRVMTGLFRLQLPLQYIIVKTCRRWPLNHPWWWIF